MSGQQENPFPFNLADISEDMKKRFGWNEADMGTAMSQLVAAAQSGFQHFGAKAVPDNDYSSLFPFAGLGAKSTNDRDPTGMFFGPESVQKQVAEQIAAATGLQKDAISEMMPVAATLAMGKQVRPYLNSQAQDLLDAFMRGFARGRPKPAPTPAEMFESYQDAMVSFWSSFMPAGTQDKTSTEEPEDDVGDEAPASEEAPSADEFVNDWMSIGKELQASQLKAFEDLFQKSAASAPPDVKD